MKAATLALASVGFAVAFGALGLSSAAACPGDSKKPSLAVHHTDSACPGDKKPSLGCPGDKKPSLSCPGDKKPS